MAENQRSAVERVVNFQKRKQQKEADSEQLFTASEEAKQTRKYLGDINVVRKLVDSLYRTAIDSARFFDNPRQAKNEMVKEAKRIGRIFLGESKNFTPIRNWNRPGDIDMLFKKYYGLKERKATQAMEHVFTLYMKICLDHVVSMATEGYTEEEVLPVIQEETDKLVWMLLGVTPAQQSEFLDPEGEFL